MSIVISYSEISGSDEINWSTKEEDQRLISGIEGMAIFNIVDFLVGG